MLANDINKALELYSCKISSFFFNIKDFIPNGSARVLFINFHVQAVMVVESERQFDISAHK
mgnify:CR=1 FL=1